MRRLPLRLAVPALGGSVAAGLGIVAAFGSGAAPAAQRTVAVKASVITVTPGKPSELAFKLSKTSMIPTGTVTFKVTNLGVAFHNFKVCTTPVASPSAAKNACVGRATAVLHHGQSATLTVTFSKKGLYEFLCTVTGHAAAGMKGLLGVGVPVTAAQETMAAHASSTSAGSSSSSSSTSGSGSSGSSSPPTTTTTPKSSGGGGVTGDTSGCPPGVTIKSSGNADADGDELGTEPDDGDGCV